jgi:hypothetical protein
MNNTKTLLQRVQSRISKRRNAISAIDRNIGFLVKMKALADLPDAVARALRQYREDSKAMGADQRTDKEIFQVLLAQERNKYAGHFRSKYPHWLSSANGVLQRVA